MSHGRRALVWVFPIGARLSRTQDPPDRLKLSGRHTAAERLRNDRPRVGQRQFQPPVWFHPGLQRDEYAAVCPEVSIFRPYL